MTTSHVDIGACAWPLERLGDALAVLGPASGATGSTAGTVPRPPDALNGAEGESPRMLGRWIAAAAQWLGMEAEPASIAFASLAHELTRCAPALVRVPDSRPSRFLLLRRGRRGRLSLMTPGLEIRPVSGAELSAFLRAGKEAEIAPRADTILARLDLSADRSARVREALLNERLRAEDLNGVWLLRPDPSSGVAPQLAQAGLWSRLAALAAAHAAEYLCWILGWWLVGLGALQGHIDRAWLAAWALLLVTIVPLRVGATWLQGTIAIAGGAILKQRLLVGALRLELDEISHEGAGHLLGRVMESEAIESLALGGGFLTLVSLIEIAFAAAILGAGAGGSAAVVILVLWAALILCLAWRYSAANRPWASARLRLTHELVERMIGHRTRAVQEPSHRWHESEDDDLERYIEVSRQMDRRGVWLSALGARGWLLLALGTLTPSFLDGSATPAALAVGVGGVLLAHRAFRRLTGGMWQVAEAAVAWQQVAPLVRAAGRCVPPGAPEFVVSHPSDERSRTVLQAHDLTFRHASRSEPVLKNVTLRIGPGDRLLLDGPSGSGKSTLASLIACLRTPESGLLLAGGLDHFTLGADGWRRRVAAAPQFHENHVITGTFAFNMLMGRPDWPPAKEDVALIEPLCRELGLDDLLARMPGGAMQMVGESGWQLSHGERSRLFLARALLQESSLVVLDESFAALDPENLRRSIACACNRAPALLVIAHR